MLGLGYSHYDDNTIFFLLDLMVLTNDNLSSITECFNILKNEFNPYGGVVGLVSFIETTHIQFNVSFENIDDIEAIVLHARMKF